MPTDSKISHSITPYLTIKGADKAIEFYKNAFDAKEIGRITMYGSVGHAELEIGGVQVMLAEEFPQWGNQSPATLKGTSVGLYLMVPDVDAVFAKAVSLGAKVLMPVADQFYGHRTGTLLDPFGHKWTIGTLKQKVSWPEMQKRADDMVRQAQQQQQQ